jgi:hypothetical protein
MMGRAGGISFPPTWVCKVWQKVLSGAERATIPLKCGVPRGSNLDSLARNVWPYPSALCPDAVALA